MKLVYDNPKKIYAYRTAVTKYKSIADIRELLEKFGTKGWAEIENPRQNIKLIQFQVKINNDRWVTVQFEIPEVYYKSRRGTIYLEKESYRLLYIIIKTKLLLADYTNIIEAFLPNVLMENGVPVLNQINNIKLLSEGETKKSNE